MSDKPRERWRSKPPSTVHDELAFKFKMLVKYGVDLWDDDDE